MIDQQRRWVYIFDFSLNSIPDDADEISMLEALQKLKLLKDQDNAVHMTREGTVATRISDLNIDEEKRVAGILIQYADKNASDPVFANLDRGTLRIEPKLNGEGVALSAHMVVSLDPIREGGNQYVALLEEVVGITRSHVKPFFTAVLRNAFDGATFEDKDTKEIKKYRPAADLSSHPDQTLKEVLEGKRLQSIVLTGYNKVESMDEDTYLVPVDHSIKFKVSKVPENIVDWLKSFKGKMLERGYENMRVFYKDPTRKYKKVQQSVKLEKQQDAATALFTRQEEIVLTEPLMQCEEQLKNEFCEKITLILKATEAAIKTGKK